MCIRDREPETATFFALDTAMDFTVYGDAALLDEAETLKMCIRDRSSVLRPDAGRVKPYPNQSGYGI